MVTIWHYLHSSGRDIFEEWFDSLADENAQARIAVRVDRLAAGNFGDCKPLQEGVWELRIDWGPGYRVYYGMIEKTAVLLLCGGDKRKQDKLSPPFVCLAWPLGVNPSAGHRPRIRSVESTE